MRRRLLGGAVQCGGRTQYACDPVVAFVRPSDPCHSAGGVSSSGVRIRWPSHHAQVALIQREGHALNSAWQDEASHTAGMAPVSAPRTASPVMVGREHELEVLAELSRGLRSGAPAVALVGGPAGMGKSRLVSEAAARWRAHKCRVLLDRK